MIKNETKQEWHERMKLIKEAHEKALKEMKMNPYTFEQARADMARLGDEHCRIQEEKQIIIDKFINSTYTRVMDFTSGKYHNLHPRLKTLLIAWFARDNTVGH